MLHRQALYGASSMRRSVGHPNGSAHLSRRRPSSRRPPSSSRVEPERVCSPPSSRLPSTSTTSLRSRERRRARSPRGQGPWDSSAAFFSCDLGRPQAGGIGYQAAAKAVRVLTKRRRMPSAF